MNRILIARVLSILEAASKKPKASEKIPQWRATRLPRWQPQNQKVRKRLNFKILARKLQKSRNLIIGKCNVLHFAIVYFILICFKCIVCMSVFFGSYYGYIIFCLTTF